MTPDKSFNCPFCGGELNQSEVIPQSQVFNDATNESDVYLLDCSTCGAHVELYECATSQQEDYEYYKR